MAKTEANRLRTGVVRVARAHFLFVALFGLQIMIYDAWKLIDPETVMRRWLVAMALFVVTIVVWYLARGKVSNEAFYKRLVFGLVVADIMAASFNVYTQRGMASRAVALYAVPIIVSAVLATRSALFAAAMLSVAAYVATTISYFVLNFNEGYKIELYGEVSFYAVILLVLAELLWTVIRVKKRG